MASSTSEPMIKAAERKTPRDYHLILLKNLVIEESLGYRDDNMVIGQTRRVPHNANV
jgi:hypothetical protein